MGRESIRRRVGSTRDEQHQMELLGRFCGEGLECKALLA
jgi:hypothetical protein